MSGQLYRFKFAESSTNISDLLKSEKITSVEVTLITVDSGEVLLNKMGYIRHHQQCSGCMQSINLCITQTVETFLTNKDCLTILKVE